MRLSVVGALHTAFDRQTVSMTVMCVTPEAYNPPFLGPALLSVSDKLITKYLVQLTA
jgi:hypothetical protein